MCTVYYEISATELSLEIPRLRRHLRAANFDLEIARPPPGDKHRRAFEFLEFIVEYDYLESLPNIALSLQLFLTICGSVVSCDRSFSKLKLIKTYLRFTMSESRLTNLAILSIENNKLNTLDFEEVINEFVSSKARRAPLV